MSYRSPSRRRFLVPSVAAVLAVSAAPSHAQGTTPAITSQSNPAPVSYTQDTTPPPGIIAPMLILSNNPEQLWAPYNDTVSTGSPQQVYWDLADATLGAKSLLQQNLTTGFYRNLFEHVNSTNRVAGSSVTNGPYGGNLNYGVAITNTSATRTLRVTVYGKGYGQNVAAVFSTGGAPVAEMLNQELTTTPVGINVLPRRTAWIMRTDVDYNGARPNAVGQYACGVVDFHVDAPAVVSNLAYQNLRSVAGWDYMGWSVRAYPQTPVNQGTPDSRVYKGLHRYSLGAADNANPYTGVVANLDLVVDDTTPNAELPVTYKQFTNRGDNLFTQSANPVLHSVAATQTTPARTENPTYWYTHESPNRDPGKPNSFCIGNDMFDVLVPIPGSASPFEVLALRQYTAATNPWPNTTALQPNVGNWGVVYRHVYRIRNLGAQRRKFDMTATNWGTGSSAYAWRGNNGVWASGTSRPTVPQSVTYGTVTVEPGGDVTYETYLILGAPAGARIRNAVSVSTVPTP